MKMEQTCGMRHVGTHPFTGQYFKLEADATQHATDRTNVYHKNNTSLKPPVFAPSNILRQDEQEKQDTVFASKIEQPTSQKLPVSATATTWRRSDDVTSAKSQMIIDSIVASGSRSPTHPSQTVLRGSRSPTGSPSNFSEQGDKIYCTHWIRHGECDYMQQGCRYKHEMPDRATLTSIGFRTVPRWWQEKTAFQLGQSAVPTVGPVMKPSEWLKQRRSSHDSQSDEESESEPEDEAGGEKESGVDSSPAEIHLPQHAATAKTAASEVGKEVNVLEPKKTMLHSDEIVAQAPAITATSGVDKLNRSLPDGDLIDFSPRSSIATTSCKLDATTDSLNPPDSRFKDLPALSIPKVRVEEKQATTPPRKVFVPAGESTEFHVADARKHAQMQGGKLESPATPVPSITRGPSIEKQSLVKPLAILKRSDTKTGLMASKHAPPAPLAPNRSTQNDPRSSSKQAQLRPIANLLPESSGKADKERTKTIAAVSLDRSRPHLRTIEAQSPAKSTAPKAEAIDVGEKLPKSTRLRHKQAPSSICRLRRPAISGPPISNSKSLAGSAKAQERTK